MPLPWHQMRMKILILESVSPFSKGGKGGFEFFPAPSLRGTPYATWQSHLEKIF
jgi:hypothetical protein